MGEPFGVSREQAFQLLTEQVKTDVLIKHCLATEAIMRALARRLDEDEETWGLTGLLHDLDYDTTKDDPERHTIVAAELLRARGIPETYIQAIMSHNERAPGSQRQHPLDYALTAAENLTGLIVAATLVLPDKKLASLKAKSVRKRLKEKAFARNVDREGVALCEKLGLSLEEFVQLSIEAMQSIAPQLGL